jgi:hypothetical protein
MRIRLLPIPHLRLSPEMPLGVMVVFRLPKRHKITLSEIRRAERFARQCPLVGAALVEETWLKERDRKDCSFFFCTDLMLTINVLGRIRGGLWHAELPLDNSRIKTSVKYVTSDPQLVGLARSLSSEVMPC